MNAFNRVYGPLRALWALNGLLISVGVFFAGLGFYYKNTVNPIQMQLNEIMKDSIRAEAWDKVPIRALCVHKGLCPCHVGTKK